MKWLANDYRKYCSFSKNPTGPNANLKLPLTNVRCETALKSNNILQKYAQKKQGLKVMSSRLLIGVERI
jgi:hypothetical protein